MKKIILMLLAPIIFLNGCASLPKAPDMVPKNIVAVQRSSKPVTIVVEGQLKIEGGETQVSNQAFTEAIQLSVEKAQLFSKVNKDVTDGFLLEVFIVGYEPPKPGFNMAATLITRWKLTQLPSQEEVFDDFVKKTYIATAGSAFSGLTRWRLANEGAVRDSIEEGIKNISKLNLFK